MNIKKISAAVMAAAVLAVAAPMTGVLPDPLSVTASAAEYKAGDVFYAAFDKNGNLGDILYSNSTEMMGDDYLDGLEFTVKADGTVSAAYCMEDPTNFRHYNGTLTIPSKIGGYTVSELTSSKYDSFCASGAKKVIIPETVQTIAHSAFANSYFLEEVEFRGNSQLKLIDQWAFQDCRSLKSITIPASVETIAYGAFMNSEGECAVSTINSPISEVYGVNQMVNFTDTYSLTDVKFAEGANLKTLGEHAFHNQIALKSVTLPARVEAVGNYAFALTSAIAFDKTSVMTEINVSPDSKSFRSVDGILYSKDGKTLVACPTGKTEVKFADGVTEIQQGAFQGCNQITSIAIPDSITKLPVDAFALCPKLKSITLPDTMTQIGQWAFQYSAITEIAIPESVTSIHERAFEDSMLKNINGVAGSYAETFARENGYTFNGGSSEQPSKPDDTSKPTDTPNTFTDDSGDKAADIEVIAKSNVIPKEAHFSVRLDDANTTTERIAYNCYFTYNGKEYEPTDTVTVRIPVPVAMRDIADTLKVYHLQDGKYVNMSAKVEDGYLVFDTDHFSVYVVTAENLENGGTSTPTTSDTTSSTPTASDNSSSAPTSSDTASSAPTSSDTASSTPTTSDKGNPDTGVTAIAVTAGAAALAGAIALVARKKRK